MSETVSKYLTDDKLEGRKTIHCHDAGGGLEITPVAVRFSVLRALFNWAESQDHLDHAPTEQIKEPKIPNKFPYVLNEEQVDQLLEATKGRLNTWAGIRDYTMRSKRGESLNSGGGDWGCDCMLGYLPCSFRQSQTTPGARTVTTGPKSSRVLRALTHPPVSGKIVQIAGN